MVTNLSGTSPRHKPVASVFLLYLLSAFHWRRRRISTSSSETASSVYSKQIVAPFSIRTVWRCVQTRALVNAAGDFHNGFIREYDRWLSLSIRTAPKPGNRAGQLGRAASNASRVIVRNCSYLRIGSDGIIFLRIRIVHSGYRTGPCKMPANHRTGKPGIPVLGSR